MEIHSQKKKKNVLGNYYSRPMMSIYGSLKCMLFSLTIKANENTNLLPMATLSI